MEHTSTGPLSAAQVKTMTQRDPVLSRVYLYLLRGWPNTVDPSLNPYSSRRHELSVCNGCILWGNRVIIPKAVHQIPYSGFFLRGTIYANIQFFSPAVMSAIIKSASPQRFA